MKNFLESLKMSVIQSFAERCGMDVQIFANPHEEIADAAARKKPIKLFARGPKMLAMQAGARARLEENYLFDTRNFLGAIAAGEYLFFQNAVGQPAINNGFPAAITVMTELETNMDVAGQIAQGKNFVFNQIGVAFNADILTADAASLMEGGALRFEKQGGQYSLRHGPVRMWPGGTGIAGFASAATTVAATTINVQSAHNGSADIRAARRLTIPRVIREKESFAYKYIVPRAVRNTTGTGEIVASGNRVIMSVWLWGGQQDAIPV